MITSRLNHRAISSGYEGGDETYLASDHPLLLKAWEQVEKFMVAEFGEELGAILANYYVNYYATVPRLKCHIFGINHGSDQEIVRKLASQVEKVPEIRFCFTGSCLHVPIEFKHSH